MSLWQFFSWEGGWIHTNHWAEWLRETVPITNHIPTRRTPEFLTFFESLTPGLLFFLIYFLLKYSWIMGYPGCSVVNPPANAGDSGSIPGLGRSPGAGTGNPLEFSCLENFMDRGAWQARVQGVTKESDNNLVTELQKQIELQCHVCFCYKAKWCKYTCVCMYMYVYILFHIFSTMVYHRILNIVLWLFLLTDDIIRVPTGKKNASWILSESRC